jgi:glycosyltransferase involved in cell wall biosynthesis
VAELLRHFEEALTARPVVAGLEYRWIVVMCGANGKKPMAKTPETVLRVCMLVYTYWPLPAGGAESQCRKLTRRLQARAVRCTVLAARESGRVAAREWDGATAIRRLWVPQLLIAKLLQLDRAGRLHGDGSVERTGSIGPGQPSRPSRLARTAARLLQRLNAWGYMLAGAGWLWRHRKQYDILHVHTVGWLAGFAGHMGLLLGKPVLCKESTDPSLRPAETVVAPRRWLARGLSACALVAQTERAARYHLDHGVAADRVFVIANGVRLPPEREFPADRPMILWVGNFSQGIETKGLDLLVRAWRIVSARHPDVRLVLAGNGDPSEVQRLAASQGCLDRLECPGYLDDPASAYRSAWVFVFPSRREGLSNALLEAQGWGIPAVVSAIPGNAAVVRDGVTGFVVSLSDPETMGHRILAVLQTPDLRRRMGAAARAHIGASFDLEVTADRIVSCYETVVRR